MDHFASERLLPSNVPLFAIVNPATSNDTITAMQMNPISEIITAPKENAQSPNVLLPCPFVVNSK
jgi:hypothetical protein